MGNTKCRTCRYVDMKSGSPICIYILKTGEPRGCKGGDECEKYELKKEIERYRINFGREQK